GVEKAAVLLNNKFVNTLSNRAYENSTPRRNILFFPGIRLRLSGPAIRLRAQKPDRRLHDPLPEDRRVLLLLLLQVLQVGLTKGTAQTVQVEVDVLPPGLVQASQEI